MNATCLFNCRCAARESEVERFGLVGDTYCVPDSAMCFGPANRPSIVGVLTTIDGLDFPDLPNDVQIPYLPEAIRTIPGDSPLPFGIGPLGRALATRYTQIGGLRQAVPNIGKLASWRKTRGIPDRKRLLLIQESGDEMLESLFPVTMRPEFFPAIAALGDVVLVSPGYSVYDDGSMCEWLQLINLKRSIFFTYLANVAGLPCIPCIGWHQDRRRDLDRLAEWLNRQGGKVTHLAVNAQTGGSALWAALSFGMKYLEAVTGRSFHWLVCGGTAPLSTIYRHLPSSRITHISAAVPTYTLQHRLIGQNCTSDLAPNELLLQNLEREDWRRSVASLHANEHSSNSA
ncbi:MAG: hypothetical protein ACYC96_14080 [Fimbriimonadaceae bacterium]